MEGLTVQSRRPITCADPNVTTLAALAFVKLFIYLCQYTCISGVVALEGAVIGGVFSVTGRWAGQISRHCQNSLSW